jgi:hypothetical protein
MTVFSYINMLLTCFSEMFWLSRFHAMMGFFYAGLLLLLISSVLRGQAMMLRRTVAQSSLPLHSRNIAPPLQVGRAVTVPAAVMKRTRSSVAAAALAGPARTSARAASLIVAAVIAAASTKSIRTRIRSASIASTSVLRIGVEAGAGMERPRHDRNDT